ncbi:MAG TPA: rhodanese-like domain-containing protein [Ktedonobacterales bacterium]|nr:rhodanese-like domain-containing protein [Ktedonobacterales bacterium]
MGISMNQARDVFAREALEKLQAGEALLVDVRESWEYKEVRAPGAMLVPLSEFTVRYTELPHDKELLIVCHSGYRSLQAANFLLRHGYEQAANVVGGMEEWEVAGLPVERGAPEDGLH